MPTVLEKPTVGIPTAPAALQPDVYPKLHVYDATELKVLGEFAGLLARQGNMERTHGNRGYMGWWNCVAKYGDVKGAMACAEIALHEVRTHPHARELSRLIVATMEMYEREYGDGSERVQAAVNALKELGYDCVLHKRKPW